MDGKQRMFRVNEFVGCRFASVAWRQPHSVFYAFVADLLSIYGTEELKQKKTPPLSGGGISNKCSNPYDYSINLLRTKRIAPPHVLIKPSVTGAQSSRAVPHHQKRHSPWNPRSCKYHRLLLQRLRRETSSA
jgi:hypothetical protein